MKESRAVFVLMGLLFILGIVLVWKPKTYYVSAVFDSGELKINDGRKISLSGISISTVGDEKHEAAIFLLSEITKNTEIWPERKGNGYRVWIGCRRVMSFRFCKEGIMLNEVLVQAGVAEPN